MSEIDNEGFDYPDYDDDDFPVTASPGPWVWWFMPVVWFGWLLFYVTFVPYLWCKAMWKTRFRTRPYPIPKLSDVKSVHKKPKKG